MIFRTNLALILSLIDILGVANGRYLLVEIDQDNTLGKCVYVFKLSLHDANFPINKLSLDYNVGYYILLRRSTKPFPCQ